MTQSKIQRYDFGSLRDFRGPIVMQSIKDLQAAREEVAPPPPPTFSEAELDAARMAAKKEGYAEGFNAGLLEAKQQQEATQRDAIAIVQRMGELLNTLQSDYHAILRNESSQVSHLALAIAKKVAAEALETRAEEAIIAMVERCLPVLFTRPKITLELHPATFEATLDRIEAMIRDQGIEAEVQFRANESLGISDATIDWGNGQMTRSAEAIWHEITNILTSTAPSTSDNQHTQQEQ